ncbi:unnamed protein product [Effrenium voratum]|uniref:Dynactin subunit 4 n=1 Tax=Effrenium voratum TaxID=2562239 RepID=A0AA36JJC1_9DINO|nr:unnamed protein product [Effrenium voratum]CAJ1453902.1 unnamed protein product [Effrenium voratum]
MYYDSDGPRLASQPNAPFSLEFIAGGDASAGSISKPAAYPISSLYFCDGCSRVVSRRDLAEDVDSYYCPHCLENMPSSEAMLCGMRCSKCWECPVCSSTLTPCIATTSKEQSYHFACSYCRWSSKGRQEAEKPEQLITQIVSLERESEPRQRMMTMLEAYRMKAQEQQRERELAQRLRRRSSARASFNAASLTALAARRFSSAAQMRSGARLSMAPSFGGSPGELAKKAGPWGVEDLEEKLAEQSAKSLDLRAEALDLAAKAKETPEPPPELQDSPSKRFSFSAGATAVPVMAGLSVGELLSAHREKVNGRSLLDELQSSIEDVGHSSQQRGDCASLSMRLQQVAYGYHGVSVDGSAAKGLRRGQSQLEAPLQHRHAWKLLPVRKPLLTKRSRRCKLLVPEAKEGKENLKPCKGLVVKPQINPCANPPFQKNSMAVSFVPRCLPWACKEEDGNFELLLILANPMETDVELHLDPGAFNSTAPREASRYAGAAWEDLLGRQNVEVLTPAFSTVLPKFVDSEAAEVFEEEAQKLRQSDPEAIQQRKLNKLMLQLRFRASASESESGSRPWVFFMAMALKFSVKFSAEETKAHQLEVLLRFASAPGLA